MLERNKNLVSLAKSMRKDMTPHENRLWFQFLRKYPIRVYRQKIVGSYIVDFYCDKAKLVIEVDGSQHYEPDEKEKDQKRTDYLESLGIHVIRFSNREIDREFRGVCEMIHNTVVNRIGFDPFDQLD